MRSRPLSMPTATVDPVPHEEVLARSDDVMQQLTLAKYALEIGDVPRAQAAIETALVCSRAALTALLQDGDPAGTGDPASLVRSRAAKPLAHYQPESAPSRAPQPRRRGSEPV